MNFQSKEEYVAEVLREEILGGQRARGERLKQAEIAERLALSITPVREAFRILEAEGYVVSETHRGVVVAPYDAAATGEINGLRQVLECRLAQAALGHLTPDALHRLENIQYEIEGAADRSDNVAMRTLNYRFHREIYALAQLPQTLRFVQVLWAKYPFDLINRVPGRMRQVVVEHRQLIDRLRANDGDGLLQALQVHIAAGAQTLAGQTPPDR